KGTQAKRIAEDAGIPHIATGDMIRAMKDEDSELGREVRAVYDRGDLVSDELMIALIRDRLSHPDTDRGFVLDGFPRTLRQAESLDGLLGELDRRIGVVLDFQIPEEVAVERLHGRAVAEGRSDDTPDVIRHRLDVFQRQTRPVVEHYRTKGILVGIHAHRTVDEVFSEVQDVLQTAGAEQ
ncbi:MAG TPA: adenylate kinase, partial [Gaiellaceae bacterium]|nr:adenylate kinase [Gaiellaceae bacterium]